ncbi:hypothetical protein E2562_009215 [Oryza meyeriana var. granulata]|uniref:Transposase MuDR plant domain-containing protein n=1 Tax=Oryza meyeriana var. granulata TaxID=110450 RepID=A0A6G1D0H3_9ORYZ|nr:hypothetical protein E2562_009215 [Oryza meyeriana var. granulata]
MATVAAGRLGELLWAVASSAGRICQLSAYAMEPSSRRALGTFLLPRPALAWRSIKGSKRPSACCELLLPSAETLAFATVIGQTGDWDILSAGLAVAIVEGIGALMYRASSINFFTMISPTLSVLMHQAARSRALKTLEHGRNSPNASEPRATKEAAAPFEDGLNSDKEAEKAKKAEQEVADIAKGHTTEQVDDTGGVAIPVIDAIPNEVVIRYDKDHPKMDLGTMYPSMKEFRLAVRQFAINEEFELGTEKTDNKRFRGFCKSSEDRPWRIVGSRKDDNSTVQGQDHNTISVLGS